MTFRRALEPHVVHGEDLTIGLHDLLCYAAAGQPYDGPWPDDTEGRAAVIRELSLTRPRPQRTGGPGWGR